MITFLAQPIKERVNQCLLIRQFEVCQVVWVRTNIVRNVLWDGVGAIVMLPTKLSTRVEQSVLAVLVGAKYDEETWLWPCLVVVGVGVVAGLSTW